MSDGYEDGPAPERPHITSDVVLLSVQHGALAVLLIERAWDPFADSLALPGGHVDQGETFHQAAARELEEETGVALPVRNLSWVGLYDDPDRDPRGRYVGAAYAAIVNGDVQPHAGSDAKTVLWVAVRSLRDYALAFDHRKIIADACVTHLDEIEHALGSVPGPRCQIAVLNSKGAGHTIVVPESESLYFEELPFNANNVMSTQATEVGQQ